MPRPARATVGGMWYYVLDCSNHLEAGVFCISPRKGIFQRSDGQVGLDWDLVQFLDERRQVDGLRCFTELIAAVEIDMLPGDRGHPDETGGAGRVAAAFLVSQQMREDGGVVRDDAIGEQPTALAPQVLFIFRPEPQLAEIGVRDGAVQLVVILPAVQGPLDVLTQGWGVDVVQEVEAADDVVVFPEGTPGLVLAGIRR